MMNEPITITHPGHNKTLEHYADFYIVEQRGWRVKLANTGSVDSDQLARLFVGETDIQNARWLSRKCGSAKDADLPEVDVRRLRRSGPFNYSIAESGETE